MRSTRRPGADHPSPPLGKLHAPPANRQVPVPNLPSVGAIVFPEYPSHAARWTKEALGIWASWLGTYRPTEPRNDDLVQTVTFPSERSDRQAVALEPQPSVVGRSIGGKRCRCPTHQQHPGAIRLEVFLQSEATWQDADPARAPQETLGSFY